MLRDGGSGAREGEGGLFLNEEGDDGDIGECAAVQGRRFNLSEGLTGDAADVTHTDEWLVLDAMEPAAAERGRGGARAAAVR
jgi:hypothetical protein